MDPYSTTSRVLCVISCMDENIWVWFSYSFHGQLAFCKHNCQVLYQQTDWRSSSFSCLSSFKSHKLIQGKIYSKRHFSVSVLQKPDQKFFMLTKCGIIICIEAARARNSWIQHGVGSQLGAICIAPAVSLSWTDLTLLPEWRDLPANSYNFF